MDSTPGGMLSVYLGIAPGAGKTFAMLAEGRRLAAEGSDVVVALVETHDRADTIAALDELEVVPRKVMTHRGTSFPELDVDAVLARRPDVALVDELAHTNVPGSRHQKRWQDVEQLVRAGIDVVTNLNVQHLDSAGDALEQLTGRAHRETVPDVVVERAGRVELVDVDPSVLRARVTEGRVHGVADADRALAAYFSEDNLATLRRQALRWLRAHDFLTAGGDGADGGPERIVVVLAGAPGGEHAIRRAAALAAGLHAELVGLHVREATGLVEAESPALAGERRLLALLGGSYAEVTGTDPERTILEHTRLEGAGHLVVASGLTPARDRLRPRGTVARLLRHAGAVEVHVVPSRAVHAPASPGAGWTARLRGTPLGAALPIHRRRVSLPPRRLALGWLLAVAAPALVTAITVPFRSSLGLGGALFCELIAVMLVSVVGGLLPGLLATATGFLLADFFFAVPFHSLRVDHLIDLVALIAFAAVAVVVGVLVDVLTRQGLRVARGRAEAEGVTRLLADAFMAAPQLLAAMTTALRRTFDLDGAAALRRGDGRWAVEAAAGASLPHPPDAAPVLVEVDDRNALAFVTDPAGKADEGLLATFIDQLRAVRASPVTTGDAQVEAVSPSGSCPSGTAPSGTKRMPEPGSVMK